MKDTPTQIVMLGGGYVTVNAYNSLAKRIKNQLDNGQVQITVVCPMEHHVFHGWTAESLTGIVQPKNQESPLAEIIPKAKLILGKAEEIHSVNQVVYVTLNDGSPLVLPYDHLLLGVGSFDSEKVKGIREYGYQVKDRDAFHRTKERMQELVELAAQESPLMAQQLLSFVVAGGGFTGVEIATNLAEFINLHKKQYPSLRNIEPKIRLITGTEHVLPSLRPRFRRMIRYTEKQINNYGIEVINNSRMKEVTPAGVVLEDGSFIAASMVLSTVGQSRMILDGTEHLLRDNMQRLYTNQYLQIANQTNLWGGGDACHVKHPFTGDVCPSNALWAIKQGVHVGKNIARAVKGKELRRFNYPGLGQSASLGLWKGITELYGIAFTGWLAWVMRWFFFHYFMSSRRVMLNSVSDWMHLFFKGQRKGLVLKEAGVLAER